MGPSRGYHSLDPILFHPDFFWTDARSVSRGLSPARLQAVSSCIKMSCLLCLCCLCIVLHLTYPPFSAKIHLPVLHDPSDLLPGRKSDPESIQSSRSKERVWHSQCTGLWI